MPDTRTVLARAAELLQSVSQIDSFEAVHEWDKQAAEASRALRSSVTDVLTDVEAAHARIAAMEAERRTLPFFKRHFSNNPIPKMRLALKPAETMAKQLQEAADELDAWIDRTPDTIEEAKELIAEYRMVKKELALEKKAATTAMRDAREESRARMANMTFARGKAGRFARDMERIRKERNLSGHQSARDQVEAQIIAVDRRILWLERIIKSK